MSAVQTQARAARRDAPRPDPTPAPAAGAGLLEHEPAQPPGALYRAGPALSLGAAAGGGNGPGGAVQFKLVVGRPGDAYEREADAAADRVVGGGRAPAITPLGPGALARMAAGPGPAAEEEEPDGAVQPCAGCGKKEEEEPAGPVQALQRQADEEEEEPAGPVQALQRQADEEEEEAAGPVQALQRQADEEEEEAPDGAVQPCAGCEEKEEGGAAVQRAVADEEEGAAVQMSSGAGGVAHVLNHSGGGAPLAPAVRDTLEPGLGADLGGVRVHSDGAAHAANRSLRARAFTHGQDIWLGPGESPSDTRLLAHEATHVVQQTQAGPASAVQRRGAEPEQDAVALQPKLQVSATRQPDAAAEAGATGDAGTQAIGTQAPPKEEPQPQEPEPVKEEKTDESAADEEDDAAAESGGAETESADSAQSSAPSSPEPSASTTGASESEPSGDEMAVQREPAATGGGGTVASGGEATCAGSGVPTCYKGKREKPGKEPENVPPNPPSAEVRAEKDQSNEEDAPEPDNCPPPAAQVAPIAAASPGSAPAAAGQAAPGAGPGSPVSAAAAGGGPAGAAAAGGAPELMPGAGGSPLDATISLAESGRTDAVSAYETSSSELAATSQTVSSLRRGTQFAQSSGEGDDGELRQTAATRADQFFAGVADRLDEAVGRASGPIPDELGRGAETAKAELATSTESQKQLISQRIEQAKGQAKADAGTAQRLVNRQATAFETALRTKTATAISSLTTSHGEAMRQVNELETKTLERVNEIYAQGRIDLQGLGTKIGAECIAVGNDFAAQYRGFKGCTKADEAWYDGNLSERRAEAQEKAALETASKFRDGMVDSARKRAREFSKQGRKEDRCAVITSANQSRESLDKQLKDLTTALEAARDTAIEQAHTMRDGLLASIRSSLSSTERQLDRQEVEQLQVAEDTRYVQQVVQEQTAHAAATAVQQGVQRAVVATHSAVSTLQDQFAANRAPDPAALDDALSLVGQRIEAAVQGLDASAEGGAATAGNQLKDTLQQGLGALGGVTKSNDELTTTVSDEFSSSMRTMGLTDHFAKQRTSFTQQVDKSTADGQTALNKVAEGMRTGCEATTTEAQAKLKRASQDLEKNLRQTRGGLECQITQNADEAASKEAPAWKTVLAVIIYIVVIVAVIALIVTSGGAAMAALVTAIGPIWAAAVAGAVVGAVTSGLLTLANNLLNNRDWDEGLVEAVLIGAATGAIGGGIGARAGLAVGAALRGTSAAVQVSAQLGAALVVNAGLDVVTQYVLGGFSFDNYSWGQLGLTAVITVITFGIGHVASTRARAGSTGGSRTATNAPEPAPTPEPVPTPETATPTPTAPEATPPTTTSPEATPPTTTSPEATPTTPTAPEATPPTTTSPEATPPTTTSPEATPTTPEPAPAAPETELTPAQIAEAQRIKANLEVELTQRGMAGDSMFENLDPQTQGKVNTALRQDPIAKAGNTTQRTAQDWARQGAGNNPREFANRYEYARARFNQAKNAAADRLAGTPNAKARAVEAAAAEITPDRLTAALEADIQSARRLGPGQNLEGARPNATPREVAEAVQNLENVRFESETAEAYHAIKHQSELPPMSGRTGDPVVDYAAAARDTIRTGRIVGARPEGTSTRVIIRKTYGTPPKLTDMGALIFVRPDGKVTLATYSSQQIKL